VAVEFESSKQEGVVREGRVDTSPAIERILIEGYRRMDPQQKLARVVALNRALDQLSRARIRAEYGDVPERELRLRVASLRLDRRTMIDAFGWDPEERGL
jgi:hypothetical protein